MTDHDELKKLAEAYFPEKLSVDYTLLRSFDNESLYAFLMHGPKEDDDCVCVDEKPDELDGPPSPRLEAISEIVNAFPKLLAERDSLKAELAEAREALEPLKLVSAVEKELTKIIEQVMLKLEAGMCSFSG